MSVLNFVWRNMKWRFQNPISIFITILQPMIWLVLYSLVAGQTMKMSGIDNYTAFILPGIMVLVTFSACCSGGMMNFLMKSGGSFYRILITPVPRSAIVLGQMFEAILCTFLETAVLCMVSFLFSVRIASGIVGVILILWLIFLTAFFMSGLCYAISLFLPNEVIYETIMTAIILPIFFLSSALFPTENLSSVLALAVSLNPFTHVINALRSLILDKGVTVQTILPVSVLFILLCTFSFSMARWRLKKEMVY